MIVTKMKRKFFIESFKLYAIEKIIITLRKFVKCQVYGILDFQN